MKKTPQKTKNKTKKKTPIRNPPTKCSWRLVILSQNIKYFLFENVTFLFAKENIIIQEVLQIIGKKFLSDKIFKLKNTNKKKEKKEKKNKSEKY